MTTKKYFHIVATALIIASITSCQENATNNNEENIDTIAIVTTLPIEMADVPTSPDFPNATLTIANVSAAAPSGDSVKLSFNFNVKNFQLKTQTSDANTKQCNNSKDGQHIHFILDNKPYIALYEPKHETTLAKNSEHYLIAFLSRSYHQSLKNKEAALVYHFKVDENGKVQKLDDPTAPMIYYSRPKGDYLGKDTENVLLDYYVWNATLGADYKLRVDISSGGKDTAFMMGEWKSQFLKNLPMGATTIKLTLLDKAGMKVNGPETEVSRTINLAKEEPMR